MKLIDSHAHYFDRRYDDPDQGESADALLARILAPDSPIGGIVNVGTNLTTSRLCITQAAQYRGMACAIGLHPEDALLSSDPHAETDAIETLLRQNKDTLREQKIVALGEIGLDYYDHGFPLNKPLQQEIFERQLALAAELDLPVIIHDRDAHGDCFETVLRYPTLRGVFHSYSGSAEMAKELYRRGWMISFSGVVTFKNARRVQEVAASIPLESLLVETDAPYLAPHPYRGKRNDSSLMIHTASALAALHGISPAELASITGDNARRLFGTDFSS
ncbi:MAG: TatD family hydrolase [Clostridia bacterium]|nr:TatD family hydrolase [Clostridia bacterium]